MKQTSQNVQIATKFRPLPWRWDGNSVSQALTASLQRLQVERVELYQTKISPFARIERDI